MRHLLKPPRRLIQCQLPPPLPLPVRLLFTTSPRLNSDPQTSPQHNDVESFLRYAEDVGLSPEKSVYVGTLFEYTVLRSLSRMGMNLVRVGGRDDRGLDIRGTWSPPTSPGLPRPELQVYIQCKAERTRTGPKYLRELEGTLGISSTPDTPPIGILAATRPCTPGLRKHMLLSRMPLAYCCIAPYEQEGHVRQFLWNAEVGKLIGRGVGVTTRYIREDENQDGENIRMEAVLTVDGQIIDFVNDDQIIHG